MRLRPIDKVLHDQEVTRELHPFNNAKLIFKALVIGRTLFFQNLRIWIQKLEALLQTFL